MVTTLIAKSIAELGIEHDEREALRSVPIEGRPTWDDLVAREPLLQDLLDEAKATRGTCWSCRWYGRPGRGDQPRVPGLKHLMSQLVGFGSHHENPALHTSAAYDASYSTLLHAIPEPGPNPTRCRWCGEPAA